VNRILSTCVSVLILWQGVLQAREFEATDLGNNWYEHEKFGVFFDAHQSGWYFHLDQGWIYVDEWNDNGSWIYKPLDDSNDSAFPLSTKAALGWMWSNAEQYPQLYNDELKDWLYFDKDRNESKYYHHKRKKYLAENFILKSTVDSEDWKSLAPLFEDLSDYNESEHELIPGLDTFYADKWSTSIPKTDLADDSNWSTLIYSLIDNPSEADKRGIESILETEDSVLVNWGAVPTLIITMEPPVYVELNKTPIQQKKVESMADVNITTETGIVAVEKYEVKTTGATFQTTKDYIAAYKIEPEDIKERIATVQLKESQVSIDPSIKDAIDAVSLADKVKQEKLNQDLMNEDSTQGIEIIIDLEESQSTSVEDLEAQAEFIAGTAEAVASGEIKLISENNYIYRELENLELEEVETALHHDDIALAEETAIPAKSVVTVIDPDAIIEAKKKAKAKKLEDITDPITASVTSQAISSEELAVREVNPAEKMVQHVESQEEKGIEIIIDLEKAQSTSVEDLEAQAEFIAGTAEAVASGEIKVISKNNYELEELTHFELELEKAETALYHDQYKRWIKNPEPYGGLEVLQQIKEAKDNKTTELNLYDKNITDAAPLMFLTNLEKLSIDSNNISDISFLSNLKNLTYLEIDQNQISDISVLSELPNLTNLWISQNKLLDLSPLSSLINLVGLSMIDCNVSELTPLKGLNNLEVLHLNNNPINDSQKAMLEEALPNTNISW